MHDATGAGTSRVADNVSNPNSPLILVVAGDPSGDLHASNLIRALKRRDAGARVAAVGGPLCRAAADEFIEDLASRGVTGFLGARAEGSASCSRSASGCGLS